MSDLKRLLCTLSCALAVQSASAQLFIQDVQPPFGGQGDTIMVFGSGFGDNPDDLCLISMSGPVSIPLEVLEVTDSSILARVGVVRPHAKPGPIAVAKGLGARDFFKPAFPGIIINEPVWVWDFVEPFEEALGPVFEPLPTLPDPDVRWYHSQPPKNGGMCIVIDGSWQPNSKVVLSGRVREHMPPFRGHDLFAVDILLKEGGDALHCAQAICDTLICAWQQILGNSDIECFAEPAGPNQAKITLLIPEGSIDWGNVDLCVSPPPSQGPPIIIDAVDPPFGGLGDIVTITGSGFGNNPDNLCLISMDGPVSIPFEVLEATDTKISARLGVVRPGAQPGPLMIARGEGKRDFFDPAFPGIIINEPVWVWDFVEPFVEGAGPIFDPIPTRPNDDVTWFHSLAPQNGQVCIIVKGDWHPNSKVVLSGRVREHQPPFRGHDLFAVDVLLEEGGDAFHCAQAICDTLICAWQQILGDSDIECFAQPVGPNEAKITLLIPGGSIDWGNVDLCVSPSPRLPCPADCNGDGVLNILDFVCFQNAWVNHAPFGDCDGNGVFNILDFVCYQGLFVAGCP